jgi:hypothetical protein
MAPRKDSVDVAARTWTQITNADVTEITFQNLDDGDIRITATAGATAPTTLNGALRYRSCMGEVKWVLADVFLGVTGPNRVWVYAEKNASVFVSHA